MWKSSRANLFGYLFMVALVSSLVACGSSTPPAKPSLQVSFGGSAGSNPILQIIQGRETQQLVYITGGSLTNSVTLSLETVDGQPLPAGFTFNIQNTEIALDKGSVATNTVLTLKASDSLPEGKYLLKLKGVSGDLVKNQNFELNVSFAGFKIPLEAQNLKITPGRYATISLPIQTAFFKGVVALSLEQLDGSPAPKGFYLQAPYLSFNTAGVSSTGAMIYIAAGLDLLAQTYQLQLKAASGNKQVTIPITVEILPLSDPEPNDYSLDFNTPLVVAAGQNLVIPMDISFSGNTTNVDIAVETNTPDTQLSFERPSATSAILTLVTQTSTQPGTYGLTIKEQSGSSSRFRVFQLLVLPTN